MQRLDIAWSLLFPLCVLSSADDDLICRILVQGYAEFLSTPDMHNCSYFIVATRYRLDPRKLDEFFTGLHARNICQPFVRLTASLVRHHLKFLTNDLRNASEQAERLCELFLRHALVPADFFTTEELL